MELRGVYRTAGGTPYLKEPWVRVVARPRFELGQAEDFLLGYDAAWREYLSDEPLPDAEGLCKLAGQTCYLSLGPRRTKNADAARYFENILRQGHGSVLEHANFSLLVWGVSRSLTHELVRHRHLCFSQVSQRYVGADRLRFVERPEFQRVPELHARFEARIDRVREEYEALTRLLQERGEEAAPGRAALSRTEQRKAVQQAARACLSNEVEAPLVVTGNVRAWRHFIEMRGSSHAETEIRRLAFRVLLALRELAPRLFADYRETEIAPGDWAVATDWRKV
jgi:thymidylate synthase (FAD)